MSYMVRKHVVFSKDIGRTPWHVEHMKIILYMQNNVVARARGLRTLDALCALLDIDADVNVLTSISSTWSPLL